MAVPFLVAAAAFGLAPGVIRRLNRHLPILGSLSGGIVLALGLVLLRGRSEPLVAELARLAPWRPWEPAI